MGWLGAFLFAVLSTHQATAAPPPRIEVQLGVRDGDNFLRAALTPDDGDFSFPPQPAGRYDFKIITLDGSPISGIVGFRMVLRRSADRPPIEQSVFPATKGPQAASDSITFEVVSDGKTPISGTIDPFP
jgi:hypothetical protein